MINLRQIKCFQAVVELGNFSRAAERLRTSQAGVSHAIHDLEALLGTRLFDRTTRRVELTEAGQIFAAGVLPGLAEIERAVESVRDLSELRTGLVRIAAPPLLGATVLPRLLQEVAKLHPSLKLRIEDVGTDLIVPRVRNGLYEIGIGTFNTDEEGIDRQHVLSDRLMVFIEMDHPFKSLEEVGWKALHDQRVITLTRESNIRLLTEIGFETAGLPLRPHLEVHQIHTALSLVESGAGVAVLPTYAFAALNGRGIAARPLTDPAITRQVSIITARERTLSPATTAVRPLLRKILRQMVPEIL
ncbi:LysR family transcriptional regulator [Rhizobium lusitanum]|uniref:HTH-type transcriptional regulator TtuA n=1 Tax=Rhizobium lusitanum TaxID=293958 RepID=A0A6L9UF40_9HYPH|nr:LysR family transcriptional regulator [Rhizobium lusitanum]NEI73959.1 LysR family transcriptional regulator [Rhizobium lusitanum]